MKRQLLFLILTLLTGLQLDAAVFMESRNADSLKTGDSATAIKRAENKKFKIRFRSRGMADAALSGYNSQNWRPYFTLEDFRIGFKMTYEGFEVKADIGYGGNTVAIKDFLFNYHIKEHVIAVGNSFDPYSMDMLMTTTDLPFNQCATSTQAFARGRKFGITYHYGGEHVYAATGIYTAYDINNLMSDIRKKSLVSTTRALWRDIRPERILHVGAAFSYTTAPYSGNSCFDEPYQGHFYSKGLTSMFKTNMLHAELSDLGREAKGMVEMLFTFPRWSVQAEYFCNHIRYDVQNTNSVYLPHGGYVQAGFLITGRGHAYDRQYAVPGRPASDKAIQLVARFDYTQMNSRNIFAGSEKDVSLGVNFYFNKYLAFKINGNYAWVDEHCSDFYQDGNLFILQARLQYIF